MADFKIPSFRDKKSQDLLWKVKNLLYNVNNSSFWIPLSHSNPDNKVTTESLKSKQYSQQSYLVENIYYYFEQVSQSNIYK